MRIAKEGWPFIAPCAVAAVGLVWLGWLIPALFFLLLGGAFVFFFRDPARRITGSEKDILCPADGKVLSIECLDSHPTLAPPVTRIAIFLSLLDVHITRSPASGVVEQVEYRPGRFFPAYSEEASRRNESHSLLIRGGPADVYLRQIVGVAARRIKCSLQAGDRVARGQKIGLMYFGSRVEIFLPRTAVPAVAVHQKVRSGETIIAEVKE
jgi:phosphatidylserine decarboxylase